MACSSDVNADVGYYPVQIRDSLDNAKGIKKPPMLHIAELGGFCPPEARAKIKDGLGGNPLITLHFCAGADHAFARRGGEHYDEKAAAEADGRTVGFFKSNLS